MVRLPRCIQLMARLPPLDHAPPPASTALGPCCRDAAPARARGGQPLRPSAHSHTGADRDCHRSAACANSRPCLRRRVCSRRLFSCKQQEKNGAVNAMPRESTGNRDGGTKRTGNNRAVTGRSQASASAQRCLSAPSERKFGECRILEDSCYTSQEDSAYMFARSQSPM